MKKTILTGVLVAIALAVAPNMQAQTVVTPQDAQGMNSDQLRDATKARQREEKLVKEAEKARQNVTKAEKALEKARKKAEKAQKNVEKAEKALEKARRKAEEAAQAAAPFMNIIPAN